MQERRKIGTKLICSCWGYLENELTSEWSQKVGKIKWWRSRYLFNKAMEELKDDAGGPQNCTGGHQRREELNGV